MTKLFEAEEDVWEAYIEVKPEAAKWKTKPVSNYNELYQLFAKDRAMGFAAETAKEIRKRMHINVEMADTIEDIDQLLSRNEISLENIDNCDDIQSTQAFLQMNSKKNKKKKVEEQSEIASKIVSSIEFVADAMKECTKAIVGSRTHVYSGDEIFNELELMGVGEDDIHDAYLFLVRSPENQHAVFGCPPSRRMTILNKMMGIRD